MLLEKHGPGRNAKKILPATELFGGASIVGSVKQLISVAREVSARFVVLVCVLGNQDPGTGG